MEEKSKEYVEKIIRKIEELFDEDVAGGIDFNDFKDPRNLTMFLHALGSVVPAIMYNNLTDDELTELEFNHFVNELIFMNSTNFIDSITDEDVEEMMNELIDDEDEDEDEEDLEGLNFFKK